MDFQVVMKNQQIFIAENAMLICPMAGSWHCWDNLTFQTA